MKIEQWETSKLKVLEGNAKIHTATQIEHIRQSIEKFGFTQPLVVADDGTVLVGHGRLMAAKELGMAQVPCVVKRHLTEKHKIALALADNTTQAETSMGTKQLGTILGGLRESGFDLDAFGLEMPTLGEMGAFVANPESEQGESGGIRQVSVHYDNETFAEIVERLNKLANSETGWANHTEVVEGLLTEFLSAEN